MESSMEKLVSRLEAVALRLESVGGSPASGGTAPAPAATPSSGGGGSASASVEAFNAIVSEKVGKLVKLAEAIGDGDLIKTTGFLKAAFDEEAKIVSAIASCKKPTMQVLQGLLKPTADQIGLCYDFAGDRKNKSFQHTKVMSECMQGLTWVAYQEGSGMSMPTKTVQESWGCAEFFANKLLMQYRGKDQNQVDWVNSLKDIMHTLAAYVKEHHPTGPSWNAGGQDVKNFSGSSAGATGGSGGPPAAPPPPPPGSLTESKPSGGSSGAPSKAALFSELNKGSAVTSGLKKVTADMKAKNRSDRSGLVKVKAKKPAAAGPKVGKTGLVAGKWVVEGHVQNKEIVLEDGLKTNQAVLISQNQDCLIQVKGKVNSIIIDNCKKVGVIFQDVISTVEMVNCKSIQLQPLGKVPTIAIDKTDGIQIFMSKESLDAEITSAKSSEMNITVPDGDDDFKEIALPEQFVSKFVDGKFVTAPAEHSAG
eukprot:CAMPEP_0197477760 /NCGR_PEP_ID=MMETSP1309-20131121/20464_1 /TAXON_ID=464262 /ORGANISM="Genus nov. species nov., Strain RCC998" /LENGTH=478 /DNA_ID=CAMNT_0043018883 /DNA_START=95 /DNA_END=1531 /DNA_ORIENTATION=-